jgi:lipid-A-disaccharide synthase
MVDSVLIIAGETSGDLHGASLVKEIKTIAPNIHFYGVGGGNMENVSVELLYHADKLNFMGFVEIIRHIPFIKDAQSKLIEEAVRRKTKYAVLIDYPGFNLSLAKKLKKIGIEIFYFISPQVWAWGKGRVKKIKKLVSKMFVLFPFEEEFYKACGVDAEFVGHPLVSKIRSHNFLSKDEIFEKFDLDKTKGLLLLMPGSRKQEVSKIFPSILPAAERLSQKFNLQVVVACSNSIEKDYIRNIVDSNSYKIISGFTYDLMKHSDFGIIKSGTSTLEAGLIGLPMIIVYKVNYLSYLIGMLLIKVKNIGIVNILLGKRVVPELLQSQVNEKKIFEISSELISNPNKLSLIKQELSRLWRILGTNDSSKITAQKIFNLINEKNQTKNI